MLHYKKTENRAFALLIALITVSIVLAIGLTILEVTLKQYSLSSTGRDSEMAIQASIAGAECLEYHRILDSDQFLQISDEPTVDCFGESDEATSVTLGPSNNVYKHEYEFTWNDSGESGEVLCSKMTMYMFDARAGNVVYQPGSYPEIDCPDGFVCKMIISAGYNRACNELTSIRATEREFLIY